MKIMLPDRDQGVKPEESDLLRFFIGYKKLALSEAIEVGVLIQRF